VRCREYEQGTSEIGELTRHVGKRGSRQLVGFVDQESGVLLGVGGLRELNGA
jgi:hypothetical protein